MNTDIFDRKEAASRIGGDDALLQSLVEMFLESFEGYVSSLDTPFQAGDWTTFTRAVHTLKGVLATLSANRAHLKTVELEASAKAGDHAASAALLDTLKAELALLRTELEH